MFIFFTGCFFQEGGKNKGHLKLSNGNYKIEMSGYIINNITG